MPTHASFRVEAWHYPIKRLDTQKKNAPITKIGAFFIQKIISIFF